MRINQETSVASTQWMGSSDKSNPAIKNTSISLAILQQALDSIDTYGFQETSTMDTESLTEEGSSSSLDNF
jgi:hypothetical protein